MSKKTEATPRGRAVSPETKAKIEKLITAGLSNAEVADMLDLNVESVDRCLRNPLEKFTQKEIDIIALALGMLRGRKDRNFHDEREFDQLLRQANETQAADVEALHKRISANGLLVD